MTFDLWTHSFCLACDKQVQTDGAAYCSESCRLADFEKTSTPSSQASSPGFTPLSYPWTTTSTPSKFYLSPAYDFTHAQPYGTTAAQQQTFKTPTSKSLTPSSSHSSLSSMRSTSTAGEANHLSDKARQELRAYAVSFEHVRVQRRRSY